MRRIRWPFSADLLRCPYDASYCLGPGLVARVAGVDIPAFAVFIFWVLVAIVLIILAALAVHELGGFDLHLRAGHFIFDLGVT